ncbi:NACHT domain-containing protein [Bradyrhizobium sp. Y36]|uniref:NACHT domain-containing protein n=1 Tax=Bradyrhizobium sp. Y36 TaxID=2035447 RepID=UPI0013041E23|nr:NACHT domain-containing protein [Bradyrhizobium sp. Y36]
MPVEQQGSIFVVDQDWLRCDLPLPDPDELGAALTGRHKQINGQVVFGGREMPALIFVSNETDHCSYAILHEPKESHIEFAPRPFGATEHYLALFYSAYSFSEAILPEQRCYLPATFVEPTLYNRSLKKLVPLMHAKNARRVIISGSAGAGKTTLLRHLMLQIARTSNSTAQQTNIPVYIALRDWRKTDSFELCAKRALVDLKGDWLADNFSYFAERGELTFALDGIDEISNDLRDTATRDLRLFAKQYANCSFFLSTRTGVETRPFAEFTDFELRPFNEAQVREIIFHKLHGQRPWKPFWTRLASESYLLDLVGNPLLLTLLLARYVRKELSPHFITESIAAMMEALVDEWDSVRGIVRSKNAELSPARKTNLLRILAHHVDSSSGHFSTQEVADKLRRVYPDEAPATVLALLEQHTSMILRRDDGTWSFRHKLIQEFYTCLHWIDRLGSKFSESIGRISDSLDKKSSRMLRFMTGLSSDASDIVADALNAAPPYRAGLAIGLCESLSQRLTIDPNVVDGFAFYCRLLIENIFAEAKSVEVQTESSSVWRLIVTAPDVNSAEWIHSLSELLEAIHKVRDGSASQALCKAFDESPSKETQSLSVMLTMDGEFQISHEEEGASNRFVASLEPTLPELPNGMDPDSIPQADATRH